MARVIAITSGKGGVGKSNFALNVGIGLAMMDHSVQILDADLGLANLDILLGIRPQSSLEDVVLGRAGIEDIIVHTDYKVDLIPGSSGQQDMADLKGDDLRTLVQSVMKASMGVDFLLVDTGSGISSGVISFLLAVPEVIVGVTPEPTSLTDSYALIKVLEKNGYSGKISMFSSLVPDSVTGRALHRKISSAAQRFLQTRIAYVGCVYESDKLPKAVADQVPAIVRFPTSDVARCYRVVATTILGQEGREADYEKFWSRLIRMLVKAPSQKTARAISFNGENGGGNLEKTVQDILDEQRRTRMLLERLILKMDHESDRPLTIRETGR